MKTVLTFNHGILMGNKALKYLIVALLLCLLLVTVATGAGFGELDPDFGTGGIVTVDLGMLFDDFADVTIQPDGRIIAVGTAATSGNPFMTTMVRLNEGGSLDTSFGDSGIRNITFGNFGSDGGAVELQSDGKIIVAGASSNSTGRDVLVARLNTDGDLDTTFGTSGTISLTLTSGLDFATDVVVQDNDQIVVSAVGDSGPNSKPFVVKLTANGAADPSFGNNGVVEVPLADGSAGQLKGVDLQDDNKIVVGGEVRDGVQQDFLTARLNPDGSLDSSFGGTGVIDTPVGAGNDAGEGLVIQQDGKIVVAGSATEDQRFKFAVVRFNTDGSLDTSFGGDGKVITPTGDGSSIALDVLVLPNGGIIAAGDASRGPFDSEIVLHKYNPDGSLDPLFGDGGIVRADISPGYDVANGVTMNLASGRIITVGGTGAFGPVPDSVVVGFTGAPDDVQEHMIFTPVILND